MKKQKAKTRAKRGKPIRQVAALPYRRDADGGLQFLIVTSRRTGKFIVPKGWPMKGKSDAEAAAREARQEAGVTGRIHQQPIGRYSYWKRLKDAFVPVTVIVFALEVDTEMDRFRESDKRERGWLRPEQAELLIEDPELRTLVREAPRLLAASGDAEAGSSAGSKS
jgi:8-oxo-dGTP pyrophosphatase MutT (NUDIX family)